MLNLISVVLFKRVRHPICVTEKLEELSLLSTSVETHVSPYYVIKARQRARPILHNVVWDNSRSKVVISIKRIQHH